MTREVISVLWHRSGGGNTSPPPLCRELAPLTRRPTSPAGGKALGELTLAAGRGLLRLTKWALQRKTDAAY